MLDQFRPLTLKKRLSAQNRYWQRILVCLVLLLILNVGCAKRRSPEVDLKMRVQQSGSPGVYLVTGSTNLPEQSLITVMALRSIRSDSPSTVSANPNATNSILARQIVKVEHENWQTTLNLWQVAPDGRFREAWQLNQSEEGLSLNPAANVTFLALLDPAVQPLPIEKKLQQQDKNLRGRLVRFTDDGQWYVQASEVLPVALPTGKTVPPPLRAEDINGGWGNRSVIQREPQNSDFVGLPPEKIEKTTAPPSTTEFMR